jgi:hypothetical protein
MIGLLACSPFHKTVDGILTPPKLIVGVRYAGGACHGAVNTSVDAGGRNYRLTIPAATPLTLWLFSRDVTLAGANSASGAPAGSQISFQAIAGQDQSFTFTVTGPAARQK